MTPKELLASVDHLRVWNHMIAQGRLNTVFKSPFRDDPSPGCKLGLWKGDVKFFDKSKNLTWDIIDAYRHLHPSDSWQETVDAILGYNGSAKPTSEQVKEGTVRGAEVKMTPVVGPWTEQGLLYWAKRGVTREMLDDPQTLTQQITGYIVEGTNEFGPYRTRVIKRGFVYWANEKPKFYFSYEEKGKKFKGHIGNDDVWHLIRPNNDTGTLVISKSNKDLQVWRTFVRANILAVQAERSLPTKDWMFRNIRMRYKRVVIVFDPDEAGVLGAEKLKKDLESLSDIGTFVVKVWNWPDPVTKDIDQFRADHGDIATYQFIQEHGFYNVFSD